MGIDLAILRPDGDENPDAPLTHRELTEIATAIARCCRPRGRRLTRSTWRRPTAGSSAWFAGAQIRLEVVDVEVQDDPARLTVTRMA